MCQQKALNRGHLQYTSKKSLLAFLNNVRLYNVYQLSRQNIVVLFFQEFSVSSVRPDASTLPRDRSSIARVINYTDLTNVMRISLILLRCDSTGDGNQTHSTATIRL